MAHDTTTLHVDRNATVRCVLVTSELALLDIVDEERQRIITMHLDRGALVQLAEAAAMAEDRMDSRPTGLTALRELRDGLA